MRGWGTDVLAWAGILGGAAIGGAVTLAALQRTDARGCDPRNVSVQTVVVGAGAKDHLITVMPTVQVGGGRGCAMVVMNGMAFPAGADGSRVRAEALRAQLEAARADAAKPR